MLDPPNTAIVPNGPIVGLLATASAEPFSSVSFPSFSPASAEFEVGTPASAISPDFARRVGGCSLNV
jgi:hypothetical protein